MLVTGGIMSNVVNEYSAVAAQVATREGQRVVCRRGCEGSRVIHISRRPRPGCNFRSLLINYVPRLAAVLIWAGACAAANRILLRSARATENVCDIVPSLTNAARVPAIRFENRCHWR